MSSAWTECSARQCVVEALGQRHHIPLRDTSADLFPRGSVLVASNGSRTAVAAPRGFAAWRNETTGAWARLTLEDDGRAHGLLFIGDSLHMLRATQREETEVEEAEHHAAHHAEHHAERGATQSERRRRAESRQASSHGVSAATSLRRHAARLDPFDALSPSPAWQSVSAIVERAIFASRRRRLELPTGPPYGRMAGCPTQLRVLPLGILADYGFVSAAGGVAKAAKEIGAALNSLNGLFEDQLGLRLRLKYSVIAADASGDWAVAGANRGAGSRPRNDPIFSVTSNNGVTALETLPQVCVSRVDQQLKKEKIEAFPHAPPWPTHSRPHSLSTHLFPRISSPHPPNPHCAQPLPNAYPTPTQRLPNAYPTPTQPLPNPYPTPTQPLPNPYPILPNPTQFFEQAIDKLAEGRQMMAEMQAAAKRKEAAKLKEEAAKALAEADAAEAAAAGSSA